MKIFVNSYFSDFKPFLLVFGGLCAKCPFYKKNQYCETIFWRLILTCANTPNRFFVLFFLFVKYMCSIFVFICVIWEFRELCAKFWNFWISIHREIICQSWQLLTLFYSGPIVHCIKSFKKRVWYLALSSVDDMPVRIVSNCFIFNYP